MGALKGITTKGIIGEFYMALQQDLGLGFVDQLAALVKSNQEKETYKWLGMVPQMRKKHGGNQLKELNVSDYTITNEEFEAMLGIDMADRRRDKTGQIKIRIKDLAVRAQSHWWKLICDLILVGHATACYDGQFFFDDDHSEGDSGTQKNLLTSTEVPNLNVTTPAAPTPDEMSKAILGVIDYMMTLKDDQGEYINELGTQFLVLAPTGGIGLASQQAVKDKKLDTVTGSRDNLVVTGDYSVSVKTTPRLAAWTTDFSVFRTDAPAKSFIRQEEVPITMKALAEGSEEEFHHDRHLFKVEATREVGYGFWQYATKNTLS